MGVFKAGDRVRMKSGDLRVFEVVQDDGDRGVVCRWVSEGRTTAGVAIIPGAQLELVPPPP